MNKKRIVIVGGGSAGWITAAILVKGLPAIDYDITLIESPDIPTIGVGEATIPPIVNLITYLGLDETDFIHKINGTYKYGIHFENWSSIGHSYMHAFGEIGYSTENMSFSEMWLNYKSPLNLYPLNAYSPCASAAYAKKFSTPYLPNNFILEPNDHISENYPLNHFYPTSKLFYAYQFDAGLLAKSLKSYALTLGVNFISNNVTHVDISHVNGNLESKLNKGIKAIKLANKSTITADYYVDCTGTKGLLNKQALSCEYQ